MKEESKTKKEKPTIAELEALLDQPNTKIEILPNGEIRAQGITEYVRDLQEVVNDAREVMKHLYPCPVRKKPEIPCMKKLFESLVRLDSTDVRGDGSEAPPKEQGRR